MNELLIFEGHEVEVIELNGQVLFNPYDVGNCLDLTDSAVRKTIGNMNDNQVIKLTNSIVKDIHFRKLHNTGENFLTESGVYKLVFKSRKPDAEKFTDWIADDVLPKIRKTGEYSSLKEQFLLPSTYKEALKQLLIQVEENEKLSAENLELETSKNRLETELDYNKQWYTIKRVAALNNITWRVFDWKKLKEKSYELGYGIQKIFDANYGYVNSYHYRVWQAVYPQYKI